MFARAVDSDETIGRALADVILLPVDCEKGEGPEIARKYAVRAYPTFIMVNARGEVTDGWVGYPGPEKWAAFAAAGNGDRRTIAEKEVAFAREPDKDLACSLANFATTAFDFPAAVKYFRTARELDPAGTDYYTGEILTSMYYGSRGGGFSLDEVEEEAGIVLDNPDASAENKVEVALLVWNLAGNLGEPRRAVPYIEQALAVGADNEDLAGSRTELEIAKAMLIDQNPAQTVALKRATYPAGWQDDPSSLNEFAWWCFENNLNLVEARELALRGAELAAEDATRANILDTAAEICNALGDHEQAIQHIRQAVALSPDKEYFRNQLERFEKIHREQKDS